MTLAFYCPGRGSLLRQVLLRELEYRSSGKGWSFSCFGLVWFGLVWFGHPVAYGSSRARDQIPSAATTYASGATPDP